MGVNPEVVEFGQALLEANDLDPVYNILAISEMDKVQMNAWLLAYSMFYHAGLASYLAQAEDFYGAAMDGFDKHPRSEERRHFRGQIAKDALIELSTKAPVEHTKFWYQEPWDFVSVAQRIQTYKLYGPWVAFKLADIGERVFGLPIDFTNCELGIYKEPRAGAALALGKENVSNKELSEVIEHITGNLNAKGFMAPPWYDRPLNVQEAETVLCKWKSHKHGHYPVGNDKRAVLKSLELYKQYPITQQLIETVAAL